MYRSSIGRHRNYERYLEPLKKGLSDSGTKDLRHLEAPGKKNPPPRAVIQGGGALLTSPADYGCPLPPHVSRLALPLGVRRDGTMPPPLAPRGARGAATLSAGINERRPRQFSPWFKISRLRDGARAVTRKRDDDVYRLWYVGRELTRNREDRRFRDRSLRVGLGSRAVAVARPDRR